MTCILQDSIKRWHASSERGSQIEIGILELVNDTLHIHNDFLEQIIMYFKQI